MRALLFRWTEALLVLDESTVGRIGRGATRNIDEVWWVGVEGEGEGRTSEVETLELTTSLALRRPPALLLLPPLDPILHQRNQQSGLDQLALCETLTLFARRVIFACLLKLSSGPLSSSRGFPLSSAATTTEMYSLYRRGPRERR